MLSNPVVIVGYMLNYYMSNGFSVLIEDGNFDVGYRGSNGRLRPVYYGDNFADAVTAMDLFLEGLEAEIGKSVG